MSCEIDANWAPLPADHLDDVVALAARCLAADGGLPLAADPAFVRRRYTGPNVVTMSGRDDAGRLVVVGSVRPTSATGGVTFTGLVHPGARGRGLGSRLLDRGLAEASTRFGPITVETEGLTPAAEALFLARGLRQVFAEDVLRRDLPGGVPAPVWPAGTTRSDWSATSAGRFHAVYEAAFRDRPGFPGWPAERWIADVVDDDDFRPGWSVLASLPGVGDVGFVTAAVDWVVQVGVVPAARGRGIGAALVAEALQRMRADGAEQAWLDVNVNNPAARLYRRLGFVDRGRRARFQR